jgi:hypothetical protein
MVQGARAVDLLHLIDRLEEMVAESRRMPVGGGVILDRRKLLELIDQMRVAVPPAVREAQEILQAREEVLQAAELQARQMRVDAQVQVNEMVKDHAVTRAAEERGRQVLGEAKKRSEEMLDETERQAALRLEEVRRTAEAQMGEADRYALELLQRLDAQLGAFSGSIRDSINLISSQPAVEVPEPRIEEMDLRPDEEGEGEEEEDEDDERRDG